MKVSHREPGRGGQDFRVQCGSDTHVKRGGRQAGLGGEPLTGELCSLLDKALNTGMQKGSS